MKEFFKVILYKPLFNLLVFFAWLVPGHSIGWAIILLTILIRGLLWKPSVKALHTPLQLRHHQDDLKILQERHKNDKAALAQAQMAFYKEKGINPLGGCLPLLIQLPILIILYQVFITGLNQVRPDLIYSFTPHLDTINSSFFGINLSQPDPLYILPILAAIAQFFQGYYMQATTGKTGVTNTKGGPSADQMSAAMTKQMMYLFPFFTFFIAYRLPAGLALYWITTTVFSVVQQIYVTKTFKPTIAATATVTVRSKKR